MPMTVWREHAAASFFQQRANHTGASTGFAAKQKGGGVQRREAETLQLYGELLGYQSPGRSTEVNCIVKSRPVSLFFAVTEPLCMVTIFSTSAKPRPTPSS